VKLAGQVAVVTGAGRGIGRAIAEMQAREGAKVALIARTAAEIEAVAEGINADGGTARAYRVDIVDRAAIDKAFAAIERDLGPVGLLTNNAGAFGGTATSFPMGSGYATSKAGLLRFAECVGDTLTGSGVLVFAMDPGLVRTAMTERQLETEQGRKYLTDIPRLFERGIDVPATLAARLSVEIGSGRFDRMAGRMLMAARDDLGLDAAAIEQIVRADFRTLRVNGMPPERQFAR
jgi:NAD(P)-dependent dehydrogenase (short-subunit alcohol dehydrogenase family)